MKAKNILKLNPRTFFIKVLQSEKSFKEKGEAWSWYLRKRNEVKNPKTLEDLIVQEFGLED